MKTLEQAAELPGVSVEDDGLRLHFNPIPNWYGCIKGFECPCCEHKIGWDWDGEIPGITNPMSISASGVSPVVSGGELKGWGHRWICVACENCSTPLLAENYD